MKLFSYDSKLMVWLGILAVILIIAIGALADYSTKKQWEREEQLWKEQMRDSYILYPGYMYE